MQWDILIPDKTAVPLGYQKPRGTVVLNPDSFDEERLSVPKAVAVVLKKKRDAGEIHPASRAELVYVISEQSKSSARARIEKLVNRRDYSKKEVSDKLLRDGYWSNIIQEVVGRAAAAGLIDDRRFGDAFVRTKLSAGWGTGRIERELRRRGVPPEELPGWPDAYLEDESELDRAQEAGRRKRLTGKNDLQKIVRFLCSRGFATSIAFDAARRILAEADEEDAAGQS